MFQKIFNALAVVFFVLFFVIFLLDWFGGCGESFTYANGSQHQGECIGRDFIKSLIKKGINHG